MDPVFAAISLADCPICGGAAYMSEEGGWAISVECVDCGAHTAIATYNKPEERQAAAESAAYTWNLGKIVPPGPGD